MERLKVLVAGVETSAVQCWVETNITMEMVN